MLTRHISRAWRSPFEPLTRPSVQERYRKARARLLAAQREKVEAANEFLAARAALHFEAGALRSRSGQRVHAGQASEGSGWAAIHA